MKKSLGRIAYEGYGLASDGESFISGAKLPQWEDLKPYVRQAWEEAASDVAWAIIDKLERAVQEEDFAEGAPREEPV